MPVQRRYYILVLLYCAGIFWLSHQSSPPVPETGFPQADKVAHLILFGGLAGIISVGLHRAGRTHAPWIHRFGPVLFATAYGLTDEIHQLFIPLRTFSLLDLLANFTGAALAHAAVSTFFRRFPAWVARPDET